MSGFEDDVHPADRIRPDRFYTLNPDGGGEPYIVNAKYDSLHHFSWLGHWVLKYYDDANGILGLHIDEDAALRIKCFRYFYPALELRIIK